jgi:sulfonate transport system substrate-binding protein
MSQRLKVGYFPQNNSLWVLRHRGILERTIPDVEWVNLRELPAGEKVDPLKGLPSQHGDHLFDGGYDFIGTGSTPPVTAQAKGHDVVYVAISGPRYENGRLVVLDDSPIRSAADLKGKRVALGHGSWQTTLLLLALDQAGLTWQDIIPVNAYDNASKQFLSGEVDAWVGSYPFLTSVEAQAKVRGLVATEELFSHRSLWFTSREFATTRVEELTAIVNALQESDRWIQRNWTAAARLFADQDTGGGTSDAVLAAWEHALRTRPWGLHPVTEEFVKEQQHAADLFRANGLIERDIVVADAVLEDVNQLVESTRERPA